MFNLGNCVVVGDEDLSLSSPNISNIYVPNSSGLVSFTFQMLMNKPHSGFDATLFELRLSSGTLMESPPNSQFLETSISEEAWSATMVSADVQGFLLTSLTSSVQWF